LINFFNPFPPSCLQADFTLSLTEIDVLRVPGCNSAQYPPHLISKWHQIKNHRQSDTGGEIPRLSVAPYLHAPSSRLGFLFF